MFQITINLNENSDIDCEIAKIRNKAAYSKLPDAAINTLIDEFVSAAAPLIKSGRSMQSQGSDFSVTRRFTSSSYDVKLAFNILKSKSIFSRLKSAVGGFGGS
jgi:hypothetical protein